MKVLFAPDWREGVPYQRLLAEALRAEGVEVEFLRDYKRGLPLARLVRATAAAQSCEVLHLHWPEAYYPIKHDGWDGLRLARYPLDLALARRGRALVVTAHNLHAHNRGGARFEERNTRASFHQARIVIAHSPAAQAEIVQRFGVAPERIRVIPHGDLSRGVGAPLPRGEARRALGLGGERLVLMFGALEPYKGIEEAMAFWRRQQPEATLVVAGRPQTPAYEAHLIEQARGIARVDLGRAGFRMMHCTSGSLRRMRCFSITARFLPRARPASRVRTACPSSCRSVCARFGSKNRRRSCIALATWRRVSPTS